MAQLWAVLDANGKVIGDYVTEEDVRASDSQFDAEYPGWTAVPMSEVSPDAYDGPATSGRPAADAGPTGVCWEYQAGRLPVRLSFTILVF